MTFRPMDDTLVIIDASAGTQAGWGYLVCRADAVVTRGIGQGTDVSGAVLPGTWWVTHGADGMASLQSVAMAAGSPLFDTEVLARVCVPGQSSCDLESLAEALELFGDPLDRRVTVARCELTWRLWRRLETVVRSLPRESLDAVVRLLGARRDDTVRLFFKTLAGAAGKPVRIAGRWRLAEGAIDEPVPPVRRDIPEPSAYVPLDPAEVAALLGRDGPFAGRLQGYECRDEQQQMARAVTEAFNGSRHLLVEAGTGVGKSLAYLVPAVRWATANRTPVVISTNTKNLQAQLFRKDVPLVRHMLEVPFTAALIKGRLNYLCLDKLARLVRRGGRDLDPAQRRLLAGVLIWARTTPTGDLADVLAGMEEQAPVFGAALASTGEECRGNACEYRRSCFLFRARRKALSADIVVANHAVVLREMDMDEGSPVLPPHAHLILDEAHNLEDAATSLLSREVSLGRLRTILQRLSQPGRGHSAAGCVPETVAHLSSAAPALDAEAVSKATSAGREVAARLPAAEGEAGRFFDLLANVMKTEKAGETLRLHPDRRSETWWPGLDAARESLGRALEHLRAATQDFADAVGVLDAQALGEGADGVQDLNAIAVWLSEYAADLAAVFGPNAEGHVTWLERLPSHAGAARAWVAPVQVGPGLADALYSRKQSVIFCSATLTAGGSFAFMRARLGIDRLEPGRVDELVLGTPFDYARQCRVMAPAFLPEPGNGGDDYATVLGELLADVFRRTHGRGLVLFTSFEMLRRTARVLRRELDGTGIRILEQGVSGTRESMTEVFRRDIQSVLLGAQSFWEGVDVVGESLTCLVVARLPFAVFTDPVVAARCERVESEGGNAFTGYSLPGAVIRFRQGFGRLIRHRTDRGIVIVTDRRIVAKHYGHWFRRSLPVPVVSVPERSLLLDGIEAFLAEEPAESVSSRTAGEEPVAQPWE